MIGKLYKYFTTTHEQSFDKIIGKEDIINSYNSSRKVPIDSPLCLAPWTSLSFNIDGTASICCLNKKTTLNIINKSIDDIWLSEEFKLLRHNISENNLHYDCSVCYDQIQAGNFDGVKSVNYDNFYPYNPERPRILEFCLDNTCNLACTMCNSVLSSTIRKNHNLPPLKKLYDDNFILQLEPYIPFLKEAVFAGGEPFLVPIYYKIWEKMLSLNPRMVISIVTNGTTLNDKIKNLLKQGRFRINISIDSVDKKTYQSIRKNADFDAVMNNFEWYKEYGNRKNLPVNIPLCPMTINWKTIPDTVRFANEKNVFINFVYVERPFSLALVHCQPEYLDTIIEQFKQEQFNTTATSEINIKRFKGLIADVTTWKNNKIIAAQMQLSENSMQSWEAKVMACNEIKLTENKEEMIKKIKTVINEINEEKHPMILKMLNNFSIERTYNFIGSKNTDEIAIIFKELTGE